MLCGHFVRIEHEGGETNPARPLEVNAEKVWGMKIKWLDCDGLLSEVGRGLLLRIQWYWVEEKGWGGSFVGYEMKRPARTNNN